jgi:hypothetical protein
VFALGSRVIVVGRTSAIELSEGGQSSIAGAALDAFVRAW